MEERGAVTKKPPQPGYRADGRDEINSIREAVEVVRNALNPQALR